MNDKEKLEVIQILKGITEDMKRAVAKFVKEPLDKQAIFDYFAAHNAAISVLATILAAILIREADKKEEKNE